MPFPITNGHFKSKIAKIREPESSIVILVKVWNTLNDLSNICTYLIVFFLIKRTGLSKRKWRMRNLLVKTLAVALVHSLLNFTLDKLENRTDSSIFAESQDFVNVCRNFILNTAKVLKKGPVPFLQIVFHRIMTQIVKNQSSKIFNCKWLGQTSH